MYYLEDEFNGIAHLTHDELAAHDRTRDHDADSRHDDGMYDTVRTLGGQSMISQTSSAAMQQRKAFLKKASLNPTVRKQDRVVAKYLVSEYLTTKADTPKSVLSASQLPFFSDEEFEEGGHDGDGPGVPN